MKLQILVADSDGRTEYHLDAIQNILEGTEFVIGKHTTNLNEAVHLVMEHEYDILICINRSPEFIATKLLHMTEEFGQRIPTIVISEYDDSQRMRECFLMGAVDFLSEPVPADELIRAITRSSEMIHMQLIDSEYEAAMDSTLSAFAESESLKPILEKLKEFLRSIDNQIATVEMAADYFGFNRDYFGRYFKNKFGITFGEYYKNFQMTYAQLLLQTGQFKVMEISRILGFSTPDYFTRVFRRYIGVSPSEIKRNPQLCRICQEDS
ncbi:MAG: response regulator transcription factor [Oscillospiraceae bacterium]|nr:response regulator transcription factor [Oscillospiraceae bacterium]